MYTLRSVDIRSCAKMMAALYGCIGLVVLPFVLVGGLISLVLGQGSQSVLSIVFAALAPVLYAAIGFVFGALTAWVYNLVARRIGGIRLELKTVVASSPSNLGLI